MLFSLSYHKNFEIDIGSSCYGLASALALMVKLLAISLSPSLTRVLVLTIVRDGIKPAHMAVIGYCG
jgi:hypothetical protein